MALGEQSLADVADEVGLAAPGRALNEKRPCFGRLVRRPSEEGVELGELVFDLAAARPE